MVIKTVNWEIKVVGDYHHRIIVEWETMKPEQTI